MPCHQRSIELVKLLTEDPKRAEIEEKESMRPHEERMFFAY